MIKSFGETGTLSLGRSGGGSAGGRGEGRKVDLLGEDISPSQAGDEEEYFEGEEEEEEDVTGEGEEEEGED